MLVPIDPECCNDSLASEHSTQTTQTMRGCAEIRGIRGNGKAILLSQLSGRGLNLDGVQRHGDLVLGSPQLSAVVGTHSFLLMFAL